MFEPARRRKLVLAACFLLPLLLHVVLARTALGDGTRSEPGWGRWTSSGVPLDGWPTSARLAAGSRVTAVDGVALTVWLAHPRHARRHPQRRVVYTVRTADGRSLSLPVLVRRPRLADVMSGLVPSVPLLMCLDLVAAAVFLRRPRYLPSRLVVLLAVLVPLAVTNWPSGLAVADLSGYRSASFVVADTAAALCWSTLLAFVLAFPAPLAGPRFARRAAPCAWALPFVLYGARLGDVLLTRSSPVARREALLAVSTPASLVVPLLTVLVVCWRYRREHGRGRVQLRWLLGGLACSVGLFLLLGALPQALAGAPVVPGAWQPLLFALLPLCVGAAILQFRMFDVEVILGRSIVYVVLTGVVLTVYGLVTLLLSEALGRGLVLLAASGCVALTALPLRDRLQRAAVRIVYGSREDPHQVVNRLLLLDTGARPDDVLGQVASTLASTLLLTFVAIEVLREDGSLLARAEHGSASRPPVMIPLRHGDRVVGHLLLDVGARQEQFGPADRLLLDSVARQLGGAGYAVLLAAALQQSRESLVQAREEERRRIRRDLHDGLGPALAASAMQLELARDLVATEPDEAEQVLERLHGQALSAIAEIRRLVDDLRPPSLDELGLVSALYERTRGFTTTGGSQQPRGLLVQVECLDDLASLPAAVEVAAYRIALEAVNNVAKHAAATSCLVHLHIDDALILCVTDDGCGLPATPGEGVGLKSMTERAAELGGSCTIGPGTEHGTVVTASLPLSAWS